MKRLYPLLLILICLFSFSWASYLDAAGNDNPKMTTCANPNLTTPSFG